MSREILVVEDNIVNQKVLTHFLAKQGFECHIVGTSAQALSAIEERDFALVFMDLRLPDEDGFAAARAIRQSGHHLPIIALTASTEEEDKRLALEAGMNGYLAKPFNLADFQNVLERWLGAGNGGPA